MMINKMMGLVLVASVLGGSAAFAATPATKTAVKPAMKTGAAKKPATKMTGTKMTGGKMTGTKKATTTKTAPKM